MSSMRRLGVPLALLLVALAAFAPAAASAFRAIAGFGNFGTAASQLNGQGDIAIAPDGSLYVSDFSNRRVDVFSPDGQFKFAFGKEVEFGPGKGDVCTAATECQVGNGSGAAGALGSPEGLDISPDGRVYVASIGSSRVDVFGLDGKFLFAFGEGVNAEAGAANSDVCTAQSGCQDATFVDPDRAGAMNETKGVGFGPEGNLFVADRSNARIDVYAPDGTFLYAFGARVDATGGSDVCTVATGCQQGASGALSGEMRRPSDVKVTPQGVVLVADRSNRRVDAFSTKGAFLYAFGLGVNPGDPASTICTVACQIGTLETGGGAVMPLGLEAAGASVYVADPINHRVAQFSVGGQFQRAFGQGVLDGAAAFQICLPTTACQPGPNNGTLPGAVTGTLGLAVDCRGAIYVSEHFGEFARIERFGEPGTALAPCPAEGEKPPPQVPSNEFRFGKVRLNKRTGTAILPVIVPGPGTLVLRGAGIRTARASAAKAGTVGLRLRPSRALSRRLVVAGRARVRATVTFTPSGGTAKSGSRAVNLRKSLPKRRSR